MLKLLIAEDNKLMIEIIKEEFKCLNPQFQCALCGNDAIQLIEKGNKFDVIISDYNMPNGNGIDLLKYTITHDIPSLFVLFTACDDYELPETNETFLGVVSKMNLKELLETVLRGLQQQKIHIG